MESVPNGPSFRGMADCDQTAVFRRIVWRGREIDSVSATRTGDDAADWGTCGIEGEGCIGSGELHVTIDLTSRKQVQIATRSDIDRSCSGIVDGAADQQCAAIGFERTLIADCVATRIQGELGVRNDWHRLLPP